MTEILTQRKYAWIRDINTPVGQPAKGQIMCPCKNAPFTYFNASQGNITCNCGAVYTWDGCTVSPAPSSPSVLPSLTLPQGSPADKNQSKRWIPKGYELLSVIAGGEAVVYGKDRAAIAYSGARGKHDFYGTFTSVQQRDEYISRYASGIEKRIVRKAEEAAQKKAFVHSYVVGDIVHASWGYDETHNDFWQVVEVKGASVVLRKVNTERTQDTGYMSCCVKPIPGSFVSGESPITKRVMGWEAGQKGYIRIEPGISASYSEPGRTYHESWYA